MNQTSPMNTATAVGAGAVVTPVVAYVASLCHLTLPPDVLAAIVILLVSGAHWIGQVVAARSAGKAPAANAQAGFATMRFVALLAVLACGMLLFLAGCVTPPTPTQAGQIRMACAADAGIRPSVSIALAIPGLAKPEEIAAVAAARAVIDPICADPTKPVLGVDPYVAVTQATAQVAGILVQVESRKQAK